MAESDKPGPGVDAQGQPVIDPTKNVLDLVEAAMRRQDDLRHAENRAIREKIDATAAAEASVPLREYVESRFTSAQEWILAVLEEHRRGILLAEQEREKAAEEQRRGQQVAE